MGAWRFRVPLEDTGDAGSVLLLIRTVIDTGWYLHNDSFGAPSGFDFHDYPMSDALQFAILRGITLFTREPGTVLNAYYLMTYFLVLWSAAYASTALGMAPWPGGMFALLFAFAPYHMERGEAHLFLSGYFLVPWACVLSLRLLRGQIVSRPQWIAGIAFAALLSGTGAYYAFFGCYLFLVAGGIRAIRLASLRPMLPAAAFCAAATAGLALQMTPTILYAKEHGPNPVAGKRPFEEAEFYGLNATGMLMPIADHRLRPVREWARPYYAASPQAFRVRTSLGLLIGIGLFAAFIRGLRGDPESIDASLLILGALALGVVTGIGVLFNYVVTPQIRCYDRISLFIAFFAAFEFARLCATMLARCGPVALLIALFGIWDSTPAKSRKDALHAGLIFEYQREFVRDLEGGLPERAMVYAMPYSAFPESPWINGFCVYDHFRLAMHSAKLRWSAGAMRGREADRIQAEWAALPLPERIDALRKAGFQALIVDLAAYVDPEKDIIGPLRELLGNEPKASKEGRYRAFSLEPAAK